MKGGFPRDPAREGGMADPPELPFQQLSGSLFSIDSLRLSGKIENDLSPDPSPHYQVEGYHESKSLTLAIPRVSVTRHRNDPPAL